MYRLMKPVLVLVIAIILFGTTHSEAQQRRSNITQGLFLKPDQNSSWLSSSGLYAFGFYKQGNGFSVGIFMAGIPEKTVVWTANRASPPVPPNATLRFTTEGRLVLQAAEGDEFIGDLDMTASSAAMLDSGNFVLYNSRGGVVWQSFDSPTDTLLPGQTLRAGSELVSSISKENHAVGLFRLKMQQDGNLVQYPVNMPDTGNYAYYASNTVGNGQNVTLVFDGDARLYLVNSTGVKFMNITDGRGYSPRDGTYLLRLDADGIFRLYSHRMVGNESWVVEWFSSGDKCSPRGLCGFNSYCVMKDQEASCKCLPGFDFVQDGNWTAGCERNFEAGSCGSERRRSMAAMEEIPNTIWENGQYELLSNTDKEGCVRACLDDCNCEAAFYKAGECRKARLPLRYGRRLVSDSNVALVKVYSSPNSRDEENSVVFRREKIRKDVLIVSAFLALAGCGMVVVSVVTLLKSKRSRRGMARLAEGDNVDLVGEEISLPKFSHEELKEMTANFSEEIGKGSFGTVFKGRIASSGKEVAVKRLDKVLEEGEREFRNEMRAIGRTHHKNLVRLLGYCHEGPKRLLVYEYRSNGSLADIIFNSVRPEWDQRSRIACGIARGILYLHEECETQIIHCDIKPQNILMDGFWCAKISDFGLAKLLKPDQTRTFTGIRGTRGYVAPEWHRKLPITTKADVYSFGIVLLELICCRRNADWELPEEEAVLEDWAYLCFERGELSKLVGSEEVEKRQLERAVKVALWCIQDEPSMRPSIKKVLLMLEGTVEIPIPPSPEFFAT